MSVLVTGATGKQGGATVKYLLAAKSGRTIKALVRDPSKDQAKSLASQGAELVKGDLSDPSSLSAALKGVSSAVLVTPFSSQSPDTDEEYRQGKNFIDAAKEAGTKHLIFCSVGSAESNSGVPHFESKAKLEQDIKAAGIDYTFLRPVAFMENFEKSASKLGFWATALSGRKVQLISTEDIGKIATEAVLNQQKYSKQALPLASDERDVNEMADAYEKITGKRPDTTPLPSQVLEQLPEDMQLMFKFFRERGYPYDVAAFRNQHPQSLTFETWLKI